MPTNRELKSAKAKLDQAVADGRLSYAHYHYAAESQVKYRPPCIEGDKLQLGREIVWGALAVVHDRELERALFWKRVRPFVGAVLGTSVALHQHMSVVDGFITVGFAAVLAFLLPALPALVGMVRNPG